MRALADQRQGTEIVIGPPATCPSCEGPVTREEGEVAYRCRNLDCPAQLRTRIQYFAARRTMDIESLGEAMVARIGPVWGFGPDG